MALLALTGLTVGMITGCGAAKDTNETAAPAKEAESAGQEEAETGSQEAAPAEERTTFTVGFDAEFPPYGYMDENGEYTGFDLDLAAEVCARRGWELVKQPVDWDSKDMELSSGSIDCIWNGFTMNGREDAYTWSVPYIDNSQVVVVKSDAGIASFGDLSGKIVGV